MRAGIIPYVIENDKILMMFMLPSNPEHGGDRFQIAKGSIEEGETPLEAAIREGGEELGLLDGNIEDVKRVGNFYKIEIFIAKITDKDLFGAPYFETKETRWMTDKEFERIGRDFHIPIVAQATNIIKHLEK